MEKFAILRLLKELGELSKPPQSTENTTDRKNFDAAADNPPQQNGNKNYTAGTGAENFNTEKNRGAENFNMGGGQNFNAVKSRGAENSDKQTSNSFNAAQHPDNSFNAAASMLARHDSTAYRIKNKKR